MDDVCLRIPLSLLKRFVGDDEVVIGDLDSLAREWAIAYFDDEKDVMCAAGFDTKDEAMAWIEQNHRNVNVVVALHNGVPVKYSVHVRAKIGG